MENESLFFIRENENAMPSAPLLFAPRKILSLRLVAIRVDSKLCMYILEFSRKDAQRKNRWNGI